MPAAALHRGAARGLAGIGGVAVAIEIHRAELLGMDGAQAGDRAGKCHGEKEGGQLHHGALALQLRSEPASRTVCIITAASGNSFRQPQALTICSPGPAGQALPVEQVL